MIGDPERRMLYESAIRAFGEDAAAVLMAYLPPMGWTDIATKSDSALRFEAVDTKFQAVDAKLDALNFKLDSQKEELKSFVLAQSEKQTKTLITGMVTINATLIGSALALAHLFH
jgi:hypothetical protein